MAARRLVVVGVMPLLPPAPMGPPCACCRLTQNMIDGFGVSGPEGVFRRTCEITLDVLRRHRGTILSIMDTFVNDPLVEWTRAGRVNDEGCENPHARDALATVEGRLRGTLLGVSSQPCMPLSVEGHAHRLIAEAVDKENLGLMYIWCVGLG